MANTSPNVTASGNISVCTFVKVSGANTVAACGANDPIIGVAQEGGRIAPTPDYPATIYAAISGDPVKLYGDGDECLVVLGGTVAAGDLVKSDANAAAVKATVSNTLTTTTYIGGRMLEGGSAGELRRMQVQLFTTNV